MAILDKNRVFMIFLLPLLLFLSPIKPSGDKEETNYTCVASGGTCNIYINAVGDLLDIDTTGVLENNLGTIINQRELTIDLPTEGSKALYVFKPSQGELTDEPINVLFVSYDIGSPDLKESDRAEYKKERLAVKTVIKAYRRLTGEYFWTELAVSLRDKPVSEVGTITIMLKPDGTAVSEQGEGREPLIFASLGERILKF